MRKLLIGLALGLLALPALAQFETATVLGTVRDKSGAITPGATVTLLNLDTGTAQTKVTDAKGGYEFFTVRLGQTYAGPVTVHYTTAGGGGTATAGKDFTDSHSRGCIPPWSDAATRLASVVRR